MKKKTYKIMKKELHNYRIAISNTEKEERAKKIFDFIVKTHPALKNKNSDVVEIRALNRDNKQLCSDNETGEVFEKSTSGMVWPITIYSNSETEERRVCDRIVDMLDKPYCMYYSIFSFDNTMDTGKKNKNRINNQNATYTECLVADFDNISPAQMLLEESKLKTLGLSHYIKIFSGHGYQLVFLLVEPCYDKTILSKFTMALEKNGLKVDTCIKDSARVMRLPYTYNNKSITKEEIFDPIYTTVVTDTEYRYNLSELLSFLGEDYTVNVTPLKTAEMSSQSASKEEDIVIEEDVEVLGNEIPAPLQKVLEDGPIEGMVNSQLFAICAYYKTIKGYDYNQTLLEVKNWISKRGWDLKSYEYMVNSTFLRANNFIKFFNKYLAETYGAIDTIMDKSIVILDNSYITNKKIKGNAFKSYVKLLKVSAENDTFEYTRNELVELLGLSEATVRTVVSQLQNAGYLYLKRAKNMKQKDYNKYKVSNLNKIKDYSKYSVNDIEVYLNNLDKNELRIYLLLKVCARAAQKETISYSIESIVEKTDISRTTVMKTLKSLETKGFLEINKVQLYSCLYANTYILKK